LEQKKIIKPTDNWPEPGDLVMATINSVMDYGAYANLDEYNRRGFLHISEISSARIRNVRDFVRESQKLVLKVLRVDTEKGHIDLSLRRVNKRERIEKVKSWKEDRKGDALLNAVAERTGLTKEEANQQIGTVLIEKFGLYDGFEKVAKEGVIVLAGLGIPDETAKIIAQVAEERIKVKMVKVRGVVEVRCMQRNGIKCIQEAFIKAKKSHNVKDAKIEFTVIAAPKYRVEVSADNWKRAEDVIDKVSESIISNITNSGGQGKFEREK
jgi:translation initiation factor 2 subunit 1